MAALIALEDVGGVERVDLVGEVKDLRLTARESLRGTKIEMRGR